MVETTLVIGIIILVIGVLIGLGAAAYYFFVSNDYDYALGNKRTTVWILAGVAILFLVVGAIVTAVGAYQEEERKKATREVKQRKLYPSVEQQELQKRGLSPAGQPAVAATPATAAALASPTTSNVQTAQVQNLKAQQAAGYQLSPYQQSILQAAEQKQRAQEISIQAQQAAREQVESQRRQFLEAQRQAAAVEQEAKGFGLPAPPAPAGATIPEARRLGRTRLAAAGNAPAGGGLMS
jgi:hypothetical protein